MACLGRPAALFPTLPHRLTDTAIPDGSPESGTPEYKVPAVSSLALIPTKIVGAGWGTLWHTFHMAQTALGKGENAHKSLYSLLKDYTSTGATQKAFKEPNDDLFMLLVLIALPMLASLGVLLYNYY